MIYYVCVHNPDEFVRQALQVGMDGLCPGIRVGKEKVQGSENREIYSVEAMSLDALQCWILDVNVECQRQCVHRVTLAVEEFKESSSF
jgi:hypothetical protein